MLLKEMRVLVVEDDEPKLSAIKEMMQAEFSKAKLSFARSYSSAINCLDHSTYDLALLDMSLPSFDLAKDKSGGGEPQGFGGQDLLRTLEAEAPQTRAIVITQYNSFQESLNSEIKTFDQLAEDLRAEFGALLMGMIYYSGKQGRWKAELRALIEGELEK
jgi:CheY-like chemotaxis protein